MQMMQREYSTQQQLCLEWLSDPFSPIIGILLNHILLATPNQMRRNHADFVMAASDRQTTTRRDLLGLAQPFAHKDCFNRSTATAQD